MFTHIMISLTGKRLRRTLICVATHAGLGAGVCGKGKPGDRASTGERGEECIGGVDREGYWAEKVRILDALPLALPVNIRL
jgi:hypothetical protein